MPGAPAATQLQSNPPIEFAVAVWLGMPDDELLRGVREGWIRHPQGPNAHRQLEALLAPPAPSERAQPKGPTEQVAASDRERIGSVLRSLDSTLDAATFEAAWQEAGSDEPVRTRAFTDFLARTLGIPRGDTDASESRLIAALEGAANAASGNARFCRLDAMTASELEASARSDGSMRRSLAMHERWAFVGDRALARLSDPDGRFDRFDPDTGEAQLSDAWIGDRARHAAWRSAAARGEDLAVEGTGWRFVDRAAGEHATLTLTGSDQGAPHQVIFARDDGDRVSGGATTDRIHGGRGDDILRGRGGDDLVEGSSGHDTLHGGSGRDHLAGQAGDDELDGGSGRDRLEGGQGDDELAGGRGDDLLVGGSGSDVYAFEQGDGRDLIVDDGGTIVVEDVVLAGSMRSEAAGWHSNDGRFQLTLDRDEPSGSVLVIRDDASGDSIRVAGWRQGAFGISLEGLQTEDTPTPQPQLAGDETAPPPSAATEDNGSGDTETIGDGDAGAEGTGEAPPAETSLRDERVLFDWAALSSDPLDAASLVDVASLVRAFGDWAPPAPPDPPGERTDGGVGLSGLEVASALADAGDATEAESPVLSPFDPRVGGLPGSQLPEPASPPSLVLRATP